MLIRDFVGVLTAAVVGSFAGSSTAMTGDVGCETAGTVLHEQEVSAVTGGFQGLGLEPGDHFGVSMTSIGDLDGDGIDDLAIGALFDDDGGPDRGAVWIAFMQADGVVRAAQKISSLEGGLGNVLNDNDGFGRDVDVLGDIDGDGNNDLVVGAFHSDDGGGDRGAVWLLLLNDDGTVKQSQKIASGVGGLGNVLDDGDRFGVNVASVGDLNRDGVVDIAVGADFDDDGGDDRGAVWILFLASDLTVQSSQKISATGGGFNGPLQNGDRFGVAVGAIGDLNGDGTADLAVGAVWDDEAGFETGALWILFLSDSGTVVGWQKITDGRGGLPNDLLADGVWFGASARGVGDLNGDGVAEIAVGANMDVEGALWILFMAPSGLVQSTMKIGGNGEGGFVGPIAAGDLFGIGVAGLGDRNGDSIPDIAIGASRHDDGGDDVGAIWLLDLDGCSTSACPGDVDGSGSVEFADLLVVLAQWGPCPAVCIGDVDDDDVVGFADLLVVLSAWGTCGD